MAAIFVLQKHQAHTLYYDFRLEKDGMLKSWALPKGLPTRPGIQWLAIQIEDHGLTYGYFEGTIPPGEYGAGRVETSDHGTYELHEWTDDKIVFTLHGRRLAGTYTLIRYGTKTEKEWLLFKNVAQIGADMAQSPAPAPR